MLQFSLSHTRAATRSHSTTCAGTEWCFPRTRTGEWKTTLTQKSGEFVLKFAGTIRKRKLIVSRAKSRNDALLGEYSSLHFLCERFQKSEGSLGTLIPWTSRPFKVRAQSPLARSALVSLL